MRIRNSTRDGTAEGCLDLPFRGRTSDALGGSFHNSRGCNILSKAADRARKLLLGIEEGTAHDTGDDGGAVESRSEAASTPVLELGIVGRAAEGNDCRGSDAGGEASVARARTQVLLLERLSDRLTTFGTRGTSITASNRTVFEGRDMIAVSQGGNRNVLRILRNSGLGSGRRRSARWLQD
jgi:hypothetical protein